MIELTGKYAHAKIYADNIEAKAEEQILQLLDLQFASDSKIRVMPDVHAGAGCTIGTTMTVNGRAVPNLVGVDIGCGMETVVLKQKNIELEKLDKLIYSKIPSGFSIRREPVSYTHLAISLPMPELAPVIRAFIIFTDTRLKLNKITKPKTLHVWRFLSLPFPHGFTISQTEKWMMIKFALLDLSAVKSVRNFFCG